MLSIISVYFFLAGYIRTRYPGSTFFLRRYTILVLVLCCAYMFTCTPARLKPVCIYSYLTRLVCVWSFIRMQFCCSYGGIFLCFRFWFGFSFVVEVMGWTGVDQLPESLQAWFEVDPWYLDSLLKTWGESSTSDPVLLEVWQIDLQQDRWPVCFQARHDNYST